MHLCRFLFEEPADPTCHPRERTRVRPWRTTRRVQHDRSDGCIEPGSSAVAPRYSSLARSLRAPTTPPLSTAGRLSPWLASVNRRRGHCACSAATGEKARGTCASAPIGRSIARYRLPGWAPTASPTRRDAAIRPRHRRERQRPSGCGDPLARREATGAHDRAVPSGRSTRATAKKRVYLASPVGDILVR